MKSEFNKRYQRLEEKRKKLFEELKNYSDEVINKKPAPNAWSVAEVLAHLMTGEEATLFYLQKKTLDTSKTANAGLKGMWKYFVLKTAFDLPLKFKAPAVTTPKQVFVSLKDIDDKWTAVRKDTLAIINKLNNNDIKKELWKHPVSGKMNLFHMVDFFNIHFERHQQQIERTLKSVAH